MKARAIAIILGLAVMIAAVVGWRGSRPISPIADTRGDGVTVVPATGTLRREDMSTSVAADPAPVASPAADPEDRPFDVDAAVASYDTAKLARTFDGQARDPAWSAGAEAGLRTAFAGVAHLLTPVEVACRQTLCRVAAAVPPGAGDDQADLAVAMLQARVGRQVRGDTFGGSAIEVQQVGVTGEATVTVWLVRR